MTLEKRALKLLDDLNAHGTSDRVKDATPFLAKRRIIECLEAVAAEARAEQRERDAEIAESHNMEHKSTEGYFNCGTAIARAIREEP